MGLERCYFCNHADSTASLSSNCVTYIVKCPVCGLYEIADTLVDSSSERDEKGVILAKVRQLHGRDRYSIYDPDYGAGIEGIFPKVSLDSFLAEYPDEVEVFDKVLLNLSHQWPNVYGSLGFGGSAKFEDYLHLFYCSEGKGARQIFQMLTEMGYISISGSQNYISADGWKQIQKLRETEVSKTAFVAMWFNDKTDAYRDAVKKSVARAGYNSQEIVVDDVHHNDYIMDRVINMIDESRFVIADFTCSSEEQVGDEVKGGVRGGVYFEAGYARGKGKKVIHTCSDDGESMKRLHFDVKQINTIFWHEDGGVLKAWEHDFIELLTQRIIATVGRGPIKG